LREDGTMGSVSWSFTARLWRHDSFRGWAFISLPPEVCDDVRVLGGPPRGFGSVPVEVRMGLTTWRTSVFPDGDGYLMPVKADVRRREGLELDDEVEVGLALVAD
jgi:hypothetical protein